MQLVEHDAPQRAEQIRRVGRGEQQRELLRRGEQDVRRIAALALALRGRRVAGARLDADRQLHLGDRRFEVARDVDRERLQRRDVERVQALRAADAAAGGDELCRGFVRRVRTARPARQKAGERLAAAGRRDQQRRAAGARLRQQFELMRARRPAALREPARKDSGRTAGGGAFERSRRQPSGCMRRRHGDHHQARHRHALFRARRDRLKVDAAASPALRKRRRAHAPRRAHSAASRRAITPSPSWRLDREGEQPARRQHARHRCGNRREIGAIDEHIGGDHEMSAARAASAGEEFGRCRATASRS